MRVVPICVGLGRCLALIYRNENRIRERYTIMNNENCGPGLQLHDIAAAFSLLTRLPVPVDHTRAGTRAAAAVWAYPLVGAVVGLISGALGGALLLLGVASGICAAVVIGTMALLTGALHEDGIADCADGLAGGMTLQRRLEIMKDSRVGAFGAAALGVFLLARWSGTEALLPAQWPWVFAAIGAVSRLPMVLAMSVMPLARRDGMAAGVGRPPALSIMLAIVLSAVICVGFTGLSGIVIFLCACLSPIPLWFAAQRTIGGYTGDILGGSQQIAEVAALAAATAMLI